MNIFPAYSLSCLLHYFFIYKLEVTNTLFLATNKCYIPKRRLFQISKEIFLAAYVLNLYHWHLLVYFSIVFY